jgi:hypothetical protein
MAALTPTIIQIHNYPTGVSYGTSEKRLVEIYLEATSTAVDNTIDLSTYVAGLQGIACIAESLDGAQNGGTANTWSGTTITFAGHAGSAAWNMKILGYY